MNYDRLLCPDRLSDYPKRAKSGSDMRSEFEKDYHRIIGSASFRRLQDKTQVFALDKSDFIRTRLTHSLEVSSLAKSMGQDTGYRLAEKGVITLRQAQDMADILLSAGLLHDIGNPPFGHFGETVIRDWYKSHLDTLMFKGKRASQYLSERQRLDLCNFEGNAQSLRVVARLHHLVGDNGMDLTKAILNTIIKYPTASDEIDRSSDDIRLKKMGYFSADEGLFKSITEGTGAGKCRHPLTFLLEAADDTAYGTADLEDGFKKGILGYDALLALLEENPYSAHKGEREYEDCDYAVSRLKQLHDRGIEKKEHDPDGYAVQNWTVSLQSRLIGAACASFMEHQEEILSGTYTRDIFDGSTSHYLIKLLKRIAFENIFQINSIISTEIAAGSIIKGLMDMFVPAAVLYGTDELCAETDKKLMKLISPNYLRHYTKQSEGANEGERLYLRMVLVNDFIAGMTDSYAKELYQKLKGM